GGDPERIGQETFPLALEFLEDRLDARNDQVKMWAAYQLVERWQGEAPRFVERMWISPLPEIRESAIHLIVKFQLLQFAFPLLRVFQSNEGGLRFPAGVALGSLGYEPAVKPLQRWFQNAFADPETDPLELEAATRSLLLLGDRGTWRDIFSRLDTCQDNHARFSILFNNLVLSATTDEEVELVPTAYLKPRETFHDVHLAQKLEACVGRPHISRYLQSRLNGGYPLPAIYQEALRVLGFEAAAPEVRALLDELEGCPKTKSGLERFLPLAEKLLEHLLSGDPVAARIRAFLRGSARWVETWNEAILKIREVEYHLLVSLPLVALLDKAERDCLADPEGEALRITRIYQSPLLSRPFMVQVLNLLAQRGENPTTAELGGSWLRDEEKDALWRLLTGQLDGMDYPFEQILPEPWEYRVPVVVDRLAEVLKNRLGQYLETGRNQAVDYCLEIFRRQGTPELVELLRANFSPLINHHYHGFVELMTHLPHRSFLEPLLRHHRKGEFEMERLIRFICDVNGVAHPKLLEAEPEPTGKTPASPRLPCPACGSAYQYLVATLYVDEERLEQRQIPTARDLWTPQPIACKNCGKPVPFEPDERYLNDLYTELLAARILHVTNKEESPFGHIHLIPFPVLGGRTLHPERFLREVETALAKAGEPGEEVPYLMELGRFNLEIGELGAAKQAFQQVQSGPVNYPLALYFLGVIAFQEKNPRDARIHFSRLIDGFTREEFGDEPDNPVDMAHHYLKLLDKREFRRSHFRLISS
ncbi:MAG: hypothetical protein IIA14_04725, partial [SAR324 cluster bacterium]|nr:hypothetical protein [SAR324 cluster bacterium]